ncbi:hypothetical protein [Salinispora tropica]|uniref:Uncharacterized protein n=1 Tax=Salinispora tropica (strain ATCC BAA-916 / DSM 44818 / JCM 13857 / NBRC 105044 / CNB-440) TaxID=369723 RepID=A4X3N5_SALTO|nr:hypothetical protein [Salinispora tropica]ABP53485.1 hypothetical protein Strop_1010 [Salinispora tropica CNB-440]
MHVFPARIPEAEVVHRSEVVEVRVARKVAPLFGVGDGVPPFRHSWVCDYTALSLAEIGRGAPSPDRTARSEMEALASDRLGAGDEAGWAWSDRSVWSAQQSTLPGTLTNATLNRYGPDTKAAAVLAGANRLLRDATAAVANVGQHLADTGCDAEVRLAAWAGLVLEVYRAQPALVVAAVQARQVQRSLSARWGTQVDRAGVVGIDAPSEVHPATDSTGSEPGREAATTRWQPISLDLVDATLPALGLADHPAAGPGLITVDALDDIASAWCRRLLGIGQPGRGVVWLTENTDGSRRVQAMVRVGAVVAPFVAASLGGTSSGDRTSAPRLPVLPTADTLAAAPLLRRRAHLLLAHVTANYVRYRDELLVDWPQLRAQTRELVAAAVGRCATVLAADDPVSLQLTAYAAYLEVWDPPRAHSADTPDMPGRAAATGRDAAARLVASQQRVVEAWRHGWLDPGAASYLLEMGIVALRDIATDRPHGDPAPAAPTERSADVDVDADTGMTAATMRRWWTAILTARGMGPGTDLTAQVDALGDAQLFHLHHYAAWLADGGRRADLRRALMIQERVAAVRAEVARREPAGYAAKSAAARAAHELAAEIATDLAAVTPDREHEARARAVAVRHARAVLADPSTRELLRPTAPPPAIRRTAKVVARALCAAATSEVAVPAEEVVAALTLLDAAITAGHPSVTHADMLCDWRVRLAGLATCSAPED